MTGECSSATHLVLPRLAQQLLSGRAPHTWFAPRPAGATPRYGAGALHREVWMTPIGHVGELALAL